MALYFNGMNLLDSNRYDSIMIRGLLTEERQNFQVDVKAQKLDFKNQPIYFRFKGQHIGPIFSQQISSMTDTEKIIEIVKKYLEYSNVNEIKNLCHISHYKGWFNAVKGTRNLYLQIYGSETKIIPELILRKYIEDRTRFLNDNKSIELYQISVGFNSASYGVETEQNKEYININLFSEYGVLFRFEQEFLKEFIFDKLYEVNKKARLVYITSQYQFTENINNYGYHVVCGNIVIYLKGIDKIWLEQIKIYLQEYNESLEQNKILQLKIEGV